MSTLVHAVTGKVAPLQAKVTRALRTREWWEHKFTCLMGVAYAFAYHEEVPFSVFWPLGLLIILAALSCGGYVSVINEITDMEADARAGKPNAMQGRSRKFQAAAVISCLLPGGVAAWLMRGYPIGLAIFALIWVVFTLYSVPPFRLKSRGWWGAVADSLGEHLLPTLLMAFLMAESTARSLEWYLLVPLVLWSFAAGLRCILKHQMDDFENDSAAGIETVVTRRGLAVISRLIIRVVYPAEALGLVGFLAVLNAPFTWLIMALCLLIEMRRGNFGRLQSAWQSPAREYWLPLIEYYKVYFPATFILALAWKQPEMLLFLVLQFVLFPGCNFQAAYAIGGLLLAPFRGGFLAWHTGVPHKK